jgi:ATP-dependent Clp protease ATP-binding subunit ClpA
VFERFTEGAREAVRSAEAEARALGAASIGPEHLLLGVVLHCSAVLFAEPPFVSFSIGAPPEPPVTAEKLRALLARDPDAEALATIGISLETVRRRVEEVFGPDAWLLACEGRVRFEADTKRALEYALREALELGSRRIGPEHVLLGLLRRENAAHAALRELGVDPDTLRERVRGALKGLAALARR